MFQFSRVKGVGDRIAAPQRTSLNPFRFSWTRGESNTLLISLQHPEATLGLLAGLGTQTEVKCLITTMCHLRVVHLPGGWIEVIFALLSTVFAPQNSEEKNPRRHTCY